MLGDQATGLRQRLPDHRHRERGRLHDAERGTCQRVDPFRVQVGAVYLAHERADIRPLHPPPIRIRHRAAPTHDRLEHLRGRAESRLYQREIEMRGFMSLDLCRQRGYRCG